MRFRTTAAVACLLMLMNYMLPLTVINDPLTIPSMSLLGIPLTTGQSYWLTAAIKTEAVGVPEPANLFLLGTGLLALARVTRRRGIPETHPYGRDTRNE